MGQLRVNRFGVIATNQSSSNQCKEIGHTLYKYKASITVDEANLDIRDFVVDYSKTGAFQ